PAAWRELMTALGGATVAYLRAQVEAGGQARQGVGSWAGALGPGGYPSPVMPCMCGVFAGVVGLEGARNPFGRRGWEVVPLRRAAGASVVGVDWRVPLDVAWDRMGHDSAVQGNLDPAACLGPWDVVEAKAADVLERAGGRVGHVFNLGHGVLPETRPETLERLVDLVHGRTAREGAAPADGSRDQGVTAAEGR